MCEPLKKLKSSLLQTFFKIGSSKKFCNIHRKTPVLGSAFNKVAGLKVCNVFKNGLHHQVFSVDIAKFLRIDFLCNISGGCFWQSYHGTVKSARVSVLWFRASTCFRFWLKTFTKRCTNNSLLLLDKTISCLRELIDHVLSISEYVWEKHWLLSILMKNLNKTLHK